MKNRSSISSISSILYHLYYVECQCVPLIPLILQVTSWDITVAACDVGHPRWKDNFHRENVGRCAKMRININKNIVMKKTKITSNLGLAHFRTNPKMTPEISVLSKHGCVITTCCVEWSKVGGCQRDKLTGCELAKGPSIQGVSVPKTGNSSLLVLYGSIWQYNPIKCYKKHFPNSFLSHLIPWISTVSLCWSYRCHGVARASWAAWSAVKGYGKRKIRMVRKAPSTTLVLARDGSRKPTPGSWNGRSPKP